MTIFVVTSVGVSGVEVILETDFVNGAKQIRMLSMILKILPTTPHIPKYVLLMANRQESIHTSHDLRFEVYQANLLSFKR